MSATDGRGSRGFWLLLIGGLVLLAVLSTSGANERPLDPRGTGPDGAGALTELLEALDADIETAASRARADFDTILLLRDRLSADQEAEVLAWVQAGGRLVIADPFGSSSLAAEWAGSSVNTGPRVGCAIGALADVQRIIGVTGRLEAGPDEISCFGDAVVVASVGDGVVVSVAGPDLFLNENLGDADNAVLAAALLAPEPGTRVAMFDTSVVASGGTESIRDLIPKAVWVLLAQLGVAFLLFAWSRARRLGQPIAEPLPVVIEGSELAAARGRFLQSMASPDTAAQTLTDETRRFLLRRFALPLGTPDHELAGQVALHTSTDAATVVALLAPAVTTDLELAHHGRALGELRAQLTRTTAPSPSGAPS